METRSAITGILAPSSAFVAAVPDLARYVNPLMGTTSGAPDFNLGNASGNTFPGADTPFGMVQWSPDTLPRTVSGYNYASSSMKGFSLTHISGPGCPIYRDIPFSPYAGVPTTSPASNSALYALDFSHSNELAEPGFYGVLLNKPHVKVELTVTPRSGFARFTYPPSTSSTLLLNTSSDANGTYAASVQIDSSRSQMTGSATSGGFCARNGPYRLYFAAQFDRPFSTFGTWNGPTVTHGSTSASGNRSGAYVTFDTTRQTVVQAKVGLSFVSIQHALANLNAENAGWSFDQVYSAARASWNRMFGHIQVTGGSVADTQTFYTNLYHAFLSPSLFSDSDGSYMGFDNQMHMLAPGHQQYANYSGWDIYHSLIPLLALLLPDQTSDMMQSLVNDYNESGCLPKWSVANYQTNVQDGDSADPIIAEAYAFGATNFDSATALSAMIKGATQPCVHNSYVQRPGLAEYLQKGYVPLSTARITGAASATLEYCTDDFAISQLALALGDTSTASRFLARAENWRHLFNPANGFIQPRQPDGSFLSGFSPTSGLGFQEGNAYQYTWMIPYNLAGLFSAMGGEQRVVSRLDSFFTQLNAGPRAPYAFLGNEPSLSSPWDYDFVGQPWQTQSVVRRAITQLYHATPGGLPGNDDLGTMSAWYIWGAIGLFPIYPGVGDLVLGSPLFPNILLTLGNGNQITITGTGASPSAPYVQSLQVNGQPSTQLWQPYSLFSQGETLAFALGSSPNHSWGSNPTDTPPSFGGPAGP
ncbi:MAG: GH92 family glycosyl hydrolase [Chloroflexi bacterium]|nr:GH92 family glycosyl hydrolase [Chloroflexota bacterium]